MDQHRRVVSTRPAARDDGPVTGVARMQ